MEKPIAPEAPEIRCPICDDTFSRLYCLKRHMVRIHGYTYEEYIHNNTNNNPNNTNNIHNNTNNIPKNTNNIQTEAIDTQNDKENRCPKCEKCLYAKWYLKKCNIEDISMELENQTWRDTSRCTMWIISWN